jgi:hypothetical protein
MRLLFLFLTLLLGCSPVSAGEIPASTKDMVHLSVIATNVRLRAGAGTEFAILGKASRNDFGANRYIADSRPVMDSTGKPWFKLLANVQQQTELGVFKLDAPCWIRSDFVQTRALREGEAMKADSELFRILPISFTGMPGVGKFTPAKDIPVCATEYDCLFAEGAPVINAKLPAGETFYFWAMPSENSGRVCLPVYRKLDENRIQEVGTMPRDVFDSHDFGKDAESVLNWKKRQNPIYWQ